MDDPGVVLFTLGNLHSLLRMHWDHEPTPNPSQEGTGQDADECLLPSWEGSGVGRFMESRHSIASAPEEADYIRPNVAQAARLRRTRASASGMTSVPQASPLGGRRDACPTGKEIHGQGFHRRALRCRKDS